MQHDVLPSVKTALQGSLRFSGRMGRTEFWLFIGALHVVSLIAFRLTLDVSFGKETHWAALGNFIQRHESISQALQFLTKAWPSGLALTYYPFGFVGFKSVVLPLTLPWYLLTLVLSLGPTAQRARDAGYSPKMTLVLLHLSVIGVVVVFMMNYAIAAVIGIGAMPFVMISSGYLGYVAPYTSLIAALIAIYILTSPSIPGRNLAEAPK